MKFLETVLDFWKFRIQDKAPKKSNSILKIRFPLLNLPRVVLHECIENLDVLEIILFSLLSKRAKSITKLIRWSPLDIRLAAGENPQICLRLSTDSGLEWIIEYEKEKELSSYPYFQSNIKETEALHFLVLNDNGNAIKDIKQMVEHICEVFRSPICDIDIIEESLIEWIIEFQPIIRYVWICENVITSAKTLDRALKNLKVTEYFGLESVAIDEKFQITEPIPSRSIVVWNSFRSTLPAILNGTNSIIRLYESQLTPKDINTILREWQLGTKLQNLEYLEIDTVTLQDRHACSLEMFKDINWTASFGNDGRPMKVEMHAEWTYTLPDVEMVIDITRSDGMIGSIFGTYGVLEDRKLKLCFCFQVWSKQI